MFWQTYITVITFYFVLPNVWAIAVITATLYFQRGWATERQVIECQGDWVPRGLIAKVTEGQEQFYL